MPITRKGKNSKFLKCTTVVLILGFQEYFYCWGKCSGALWVILASTAPAMVSLAGSHFYLLCVTVCYWVFPQHISRQHFLSLCPDWQETLRQQSAVERSLKRQPGWHYLQDAWNSTLHFLAVPEILPLRNASWFTCCEDSTLGWICLAVCFIGGLMKTPKENAEEKHPRDLGHLGSLAS